MTSIEEVNEHPEPSFGSALLCCSGILVIIIASVFLFEIELHIALILALFGHHLTPPYLASDFAIPKHL